ncbi:MAG: class I mannose-6-phosphate isomerase [Ignavibacteria bacterium]|nr:class I mannose-6-phosphate isomerase [Ignavibacteria bacterium]
MKTKLGKQFTTDEPIGESWEIYSGNRIVNGQFTGQTLHDVLTQFPAEILGKHVQDDFPLLVKFLDARDWLSVQVHPDDALALELEGEQRGKTECWYILAAEENAQIIYGCSREVTSDEFKHALLNGNSRDVLQFVNVKAGDFIYVPAGTIHAIGTGILLYELQQTSDTTYRLYDWDRAGLDGKPRQLHIEKGVQCSLLNVRPTAQFPYTTNNSPDGNAISSLVHEKYFVLDVLSLANPILRNTFFETPHLLTIATGNVEIHGDFDTVILPLGSSALLPANTGEYHIIPTELSTVLCAYIS